MEEYLPVSEAAARLGISPRRVRQILASGGLEGELVGGRWFVKTSDALHRQRLTPPAGRPLSVPSAWDLLAVLSDASEHVAQLSPVRRARARSRARALSAHGVNPDTWPHLFRRRATVSRWFAHPGIVRELSEDPRAVAGGISAAALHGADLVSFDGAELYVPAEALQDFVHRNGLLPAERANANVVLRAASPEAAWLLARDVAPAPVVAVDLLDHEEYRDRHAGALLIMGSNQ